MIVSFLGMVSSFLLINIAFQKSLLSYLETFESRTGELLWHEGFTNRKLGTARLNVQGDYKSTSGSESSQWND